MISYDKNPVTVRGEALHEVWWQGRQWAVTSYGLERRYGTYFIEAKRLVEQLRGEHPYSWTEHVGEKTWADVDDFATAYLVAVAMHGHRLTKAMRAIVMKGHAKAVVSHEKSKLHREMFPAPRERFELIDLVELNRRCEAVEAEYRRRKGAS